MNCEIVLRTAKISENEYITIAVFLESDNKEAFYQITTLLYNQISSFNSEDIGIRGNLLVCTLSYIDSSNSYL